MPSTLFKRSSIYTCRYQCSDSRDGGPGGISSEDVPSLARSAFVHNAIVRSISPGQVPCHRPWTFALVSQDLKGSRETPIMTVELPEKMCPNILCTVKVPMILPQRYSTLQKPISGCQRQVGSERVALINIAVRTLGNGQAQHIPVSFTTT